MLDTLNLDTIDPNSRLPENEPMRQFVFMAKCREILRDREQRLGRPLKASLQAFGCQMSANDVQTLTGIAKQIGFEEADSEEADLVLYNTCTVRENANERIYGRLGHLHSLKKKNPDMVIAISGCMMQEETEIETIKKVYPFVDLVFGTHNVYKFAELLYMVWTTDKMVVDVWKDSPLIVENLPVQRKYPFKTGVNISFGCDNFCTYCILPYVRGREKSRTPESILEEIRRHADSGAVEIMLLGQNVNSYGKGLEAPCSFPELLRRVEEIDGIERIRFMTSHPKDLSDELIQVMKESDKIARHLHLPMQSGSTEILKRMNRRYTKEQYLELAGKVRREIPDMAITTDIIVGFPGETEEDFEDTMDVVRQVRFEGAFTFIYSRRTGTPAAKWEQVPQQVIQPRFDRLLKEVQTIAAEKCALGTGKVEKVLVESLDSHDEKMLSGRLSNNMMVHFPGPSCLIGQMVPVRITEAHGFYYIGEMWKGR